ncbi:MAG TPA: hypothetical protein VFM18_20245 [Methanosarcina sp.]|nr:hypothetical protein [Methanosarcina sp.]
MGTIIHDHVVITMYDYNREKVVEVENYLREHFQNTFAGPISSPVNGFITFVVTTSGSKLGWEHYNNHRNEIDFLKKFLISNNVYASYVHLTFGDSCDCSAYIEDCSSCLKEDVDEPDSLY